MERADQDERLAALEPQAPDGKPEAPESLSHSFVVKVWIEETAAEAGNTMWRGHITHVGTKSRRYIQRLDEIPMFIAPYLQSLGVEVGLDAPPETDEGEG